MTKKFIYLLFKDGEGGEPKEHKTDEGSEGKGLGEEGEGKDPKNEPKSEPKKQTKEAEKKVSITAKEFEEYKQKPMDWENILCRLFSERQCQYQEKRNC